MPENKLLAARLKTQYKIPIAKSFAQVMGQFGANANIPLPAPKKNFEQRILNPALKLNNPDGSTSTHEMMSFESDGKFYAAPTIVQQGDKLVRLSQDEAFRYAMKSGEFKEFTSDAEARKYADNGYKIGTPLEEKKSPLKHSSILKLRP